MKLRELQRNWDRMGATDPLWAVATAPQYKDNRWDPDEFFVTGSEQVTTMLGAVEELGIDLRWERALDFGCGVGRLTQALARRFAAVCGVDIAPSMIDEASRYNRFPGTCEYAHNPDDDLGRFADASFDLVYSEITLMHMAPTYSRRYISEFVRVARPDGIVVFQLPVPTTRQRARAALPAALVDAGNRLRTLRRPMMEIYGMARREVEGLVVDAGGEVLRVEDLGIRHGSAMDHRYYVRPLARLRSTGRPRYPRRARTK